MTCCQLHMHNMVYTEKYLQHRFICQVFVPLIKVTLTLNKELAMNMLLSITMSLSFFCLIVLMLLIPFETRGIYGSIPTRINNFATYLGTFCGFVGVCIMIFR